MSDNERNWPFVNRGCKVLWCGEFGPTTGFANVSENIVDRLFNLRTEWGTRKFFPHVMALGQGVNPFGAQSNKPYPVIPMYGKNPTARFGEDYATDLINRVKPDIVIAFGDTWMIDYWNNPGVVPAELRKTFKLVGYVAIDGYPIPRFWIDKYKNFDKVILFTKFGKDAVDERAKEMGVRLATSYIYHGVNPQVFRPIPKNIVEQFKAQSGLKDKVVIGMFSRNQPRKHHPEFIEFAAQFLEKVDNDPKYMFYLHCMKEDAGWDIPHLIEDLDKLNLRGRFQKYGWVGPGQEIPEKKYDLRSRFIFPDIANPAQGYPVDRLNMMYNILDCHILLTSGEGAGLTAYESLSAGIPTLTNEYAALREIIEESGGGELIKAREYTYRGSDHNFYRPHTDYNDAIEKTLKILNDPELHKKYSKRGRAWGLGQSWDIIVDSWDKELSSLYGFDGNYVQKTEAI